LFEAVKNYAMKDMNKLRWEYLINKNILVLIGKNFLVAFGTIWLLIECSSALSAKIKDFIAGFDPWILLIASLASLIFSVIKSFPRVSFTKKFKSTQTSISFKVGNLLNENENIVIGSSDYFDFNQNTTTGVSLKSQMISKLFNNDVDFINNLIQKSLVGLEAIAEKNEKKFDGNKLRYPAGTVAVLPQASRKIFVVILTKLAFIGKDKHTESDPQMLNQALIGLWDKIKVEGSKKKFSIPVLGAGLANVNLSYLLIIQNIILSYAIYSRSSPISKEMTLVINPNDYNPGDFEEAIQFLNSLQI
jgi:hypothetical protein